MASRRLAGLDQKKDRSEPARLSFFASHGIQRRACATS